MSPRNTVARVLERLVIVLSLVILVMSLLSIASIFVIRQEVLETTRTISPLNEQSGQMRITVSEAQGSYRAYLLTEEETFREDYVASRDDFRRGEAVLRQRAERADMDEGRVEDFIAAADEWFRLADAQMRSPSRAPLRQTAPAFAEVEREHDALVTQITEVRQQRRDRYGLLMTGGVAVMGGAALVALVVTIGQTRRTHRRLARPLQALHRVVTGHQTGTTLERADVTDGADEVIALAGAFNTLAESNASMHRERERRIDLYRVTGSVPGLLTARDGGWDSACARLGEGLGVDAVSIYRLTGTRTAERIGSWSSSGENFSAAVQELDIPGLARLLADTPILRARDRREVTATFPRPLPKVAAGEALEGWVLHPLLFGDEPVGALSVATLAPHDWDQAEVQAMERVAEYAAHTFVEQRYVASLEELDQQKSDFTATTSHELRTPLTSIAGYLELLEDGDLGELTAPQGNALGVISRNVERLRSLIDDLLLLNRLDSGAVQRTHEEHDVRCGATRVVEQLEPVARAAGVDLVFDHGDEPLLVHGDAVQIERAVGNVVSNAVKFTPAGGQVHLTTRQEGGEVRIVCSDTGMGIPAADQQRLFTRFFRASNAQEGHVPGTGLGLVIVETIARAHGGGVTLDSVEGEGTTVTITLAPDPAKP